MKNHEKKGAPAHGRKKIFYIKFTNGGEIKIRAKSKRMAIIKAIAKTGLPLNQIKSMNRLYC